MEFSVILILGILVPIGVIYGIYRFAKNSPPAQSHPNGPAGVAGWLLLLVVGLIFFGPLSGWGGIDESFRTAESQYPNLLELDTWHVYKLATWWSFLVVACLSIYAGLGLARGRNASVVTRAKILLWVTGPVALIFLDMFLPLWIFGQIEPDPQFFGMLIGSALGASIWTAYLSISRRVKATYFPPESEDPTTGSAQT